MTTPTTDPREALLRPFFKRTESVWSLFVAEGQINSEPTHGCCEYRLTAYDDNKWLLEMSSTEANRVCYQGSVPSNPFLIRLLENIDTPVPIPKPEFHHYHCVDCGTQLVELGLGVLGCPECEEQFIPVGTPDGGLSLCWQEKKS